MRFCVLQISVFYGLILVAVRAQDSCKPFQYYHPQHDEKRGNQTNQLLRAAFANLDQWLDALAASQGITSISFGVVYDQELIHYSSVGVTDRRQNTRPTADSIYRIGSISKVFTVLLAYRLRDQGLISFEDPIAKFNSNFTINNPWGITDEEVAGKTLTVRHLASQVSGLPREAPCLEDCVGISTAEILERLSPQTLLHATDVQPSYSNLAFALLGNLFSDHVGDLSYSDTLFKTIIGPLGLLNTGLYLTEFQKQGNATTGYDEDDKPVSYIDIGWVGPAGQIFSSVSDLSILIMQYFAAFPSLYQRSLSKEHTFVISPQSLREMLRPVFLNPDQQTGFGSPWELFTRRGHLIRCKGGNINGFSSEIAMVPELKLGIVALMNSEATGSVITNSALDILIPAFENWVSERKSTEMDGPPKSDFGGIEGDYGIEGELLFRVYEDETSVFPMISGPHSYQHGILQPTTCDEQSCMYIYIELFTNALFCFTITIGGIDGIPVTFINWKDGKAQGFRADGELYGVEFGRMTDTTEQGYSFLKPSTAWGNLGRFKSWTLSPFLYDVVIHGTTMTE